MAILPNKSGLTGCPWNNEFSCRVLHVRCSSWCQPAQTHWNSPFLHILRLPDGAASLHFVSALCSALELSPFSRRTWVLPVPEGPFWTLLELSTIYHPAICPTLCQPVSVSPLPSRRCLWSAARGDLVIPATRTVCYGPRSFAVAGPATWNSLPASLRDDQQSVAAFRRLLKTELFTRAYDSTLACSWLLLTVRVGEHNFTTTTTTATATATTTTTNCY